MTTALSFTQQGQQKQHPPVAPSSINHGMFTPQEVVALKVLAPFAKKVAVQFHSDKFKSKFGFKSHSSVWVFEQIMFGCLKLALLVFIFYVCLSFMQHVMAEVWIIVRIGLMDVTNLANVIFKVIIDVWNILKYPVSILIDVWNLLIEIADVFDAHIRPIHVNLKISSEQELLPEAFFRFLQIGEVCKYYTNWESVLIGAFYWATSSNLCLFVRPFYAVSATRPLVSAFYFGEAWAAPHEFGGRNCEASLTDIDCIALGFGFVLRDLILPNEILILTIVSFWGLIHYFYHLFIRYIKAFYFDYVHGVDHAVKMAHQQTKFELFKFKMD